jgi:uncharacterized protein YecT (DUF1311 family)
MQTNMINTETVIRDEFDAWYSDGGAEPEAIARTGDRYRLLQAQQAWVAFRAGWQSRRTPESE